MNEQQFDAWWSKAVAEAAWLATFTATSLDDKIVQALGTDELRDDFYALLRKHGVVK